MKNILLLCATITLFTTLRSTVAQASDQSSVEQTTPPQVQPAQTPTQPNTGAEAAAESGVLSTRAMRENSRYFALGNYAPIDLIVPSKIGLSAGLIETADHTLEVEYLRGKLGVSGLISDIGAVTDQRLSLIRRSYLGYNSFHWSYGVSYYDVNVKLGDDILNGLAGQHSEVDLLEAKALGLVVAVGNRWTFNNGVTVGVDWISWSQPLVTLSEKNEFLKYVTDPTDRDNVEKAVTIIAKTPRISLVKVQIGMLF